MAIKIDLRGNTYGELTVLDIAVDEPGKKKKWLCKCSCGNKCIVSGSNLRSGHTIRCAQCGYKTVAKKNTTHGKTGTKLYYVWRGMLNRCENEKFHSYSDYEPEGYLFARTGTIHKSFLVGRRNRDMLITLK